LSRTWRHAFGSREPRKSPRVEQTRWRRTLESLRHEHEYSGVRREEHEQGGSVKYPDCLSCLVEADMGVLHRPRPRPAESCFVVVDPPLFYPTCKSHFLETESGLKERGLEYRVIHRSGMRRMRLCALRAQQDSQAGAGGPGRNESLRDGLKPEALATEIDQ